MTESPRAGRASERTSGRASGGAESPGGVSVRIKQAVIVLVGLVLAVVMTFLGLWQMSVFESQRAGTAQARVAQQVVSWSGDQARRGQADEVYGRRVSVTGTYLPSTQLLIGQAWPLRVVTGLRMTSGETIPVVRGAVNQGEHIAAIPKGRVTVTGVLLASDAQPSDPTTSKVYIPAKVEPALRLEVLAQDWPQPLIPGYVTVSSDAAKASGMRAPDLPLPETGGGERNRGYALQWWAFAAFALGMSIVFARSAGRKGRGHSEGGRGTGDDG
ncbi:hypothetical protein JS278_03141 [Acidipropionibacterium virtanenii]|uniref:SURF1-like protein n=2 Tax=Acidipropionibacterium virtanenii TaxID=2057246 RepID=A0A344UYC7_9ACTN|nr:hypothetical protein JS278_03141 [Acidipropionibacterium virtanenii]